MVPCLFTKLNISNCSDKLAQISMWFGYLNLNSCTLIINTLDYQISRTNLGDYLIFNGIIYSILEISCYKLPSLWLGFDNLHFWSFVQIILGSKSKARREILEQMGYEFTIMVNLWLSICCSLAHFVGRGFLLIHVCVVDCRYWWKGYTQRKTGRFGYGSCWG